MQDFLLLPTGRHRLHCGNCRGLVGGGSTPQLNVFNLPRRACLFVFDGSDVTLTLTDPKNVKNTNFFVNTWVFKAQNAPKPVFGRGSASNPDGGAYDAPPDPLVRLGRRLASEPPPSSLRLIPTLIVLQQVWRIYRRYE